MADLSDSLLCTDPEGLADTEFDAGGGDSTQWLPGKYKMLVEKAANKANREATNSAPVVTLKCLAVIESEAEDEGEVRFVGKRYNARNQTKTKNIEKSKENQAMLGKLIKICGKMDLWIKSVADRKAKGKKIDDDYIAFFINDECAGKTVIVTLSRQWNEDATRTAHAVKEPNKPFRPYFDHAYSAVEAVGVAPARVNEAPVMEKNTATAAATADENPFG